MSIPTFLTRRRHSLFRRSTLETMVILFSSIAILLILVSIIEGTDAGTQKWKSIRKTNVVGFFAQDLVETNDTTFDYITSNFGLLDKFQISGLDERDFGLESREEVTLETRDGNEKKKAPWKKLENAIKKLNEKAPRGTAYKVLYLARHGQGYHNVAEAFYGTPLWDCYWSLQDGNGTSKWADAQLTNIGIEEAQKANAAFKTQIKANLPLPDVHYSSPLSRAASTLQITWGDITLNGHHGAKPIFKEGVRETIGVHTCDRRSTKTWLRGKYPNFVFEKGFAETDELWDPVWREPNEARNIRLSKALDEIFTDTSDTFISITAHGGAITSILEVIGHRKFSLQTGGVIPAVVKVEYLPQEEPSPASVGASYTAPTCTVNPTATSS